MARSRLITAVTVLAAMLTGSHANKAKEKAAQCDACARVSWNYVIQALPYLEELKKGKDKQENYWKREELAESFGESMCAYGNIKNNVTLFRGCSTLEDKRAEDVMEALVTWSGGYKGADLTDREQIASHAVALHEAMCIEGLRLCKDKRTLQTIDPLAPKKEGHESQHAADPEYPHLKAHRKGLVHPMVSGNMRETIVGSEASNTLDKSVLLYVNFHASPTCFPFALWSDEPSPIEEDGYSECVAGLSDDMGTIHNKFNPTYQELAWMLRDVDGLHVADIDARANDLLPPWDGIADPTVLLFPRNDKAKSVKFAKMKNGECSLLELLAWVSGTLQKLGEEDTARQIIKATRVVTDTLPSEYLHDWHEDENALKTMRTMKKEEL